ncbi:TonB-dependent receptor domain-containing protein [Paraferrimonas sedimenticola]|uniref:Iron complex outermembrane recepter protein n=1 Tax=Paraferrimonas sedimenticola TaxID=375674 RepID=A0AA37VTT2_9GAMM|nr:TonB-dependent receptor [Paraferrimonas sedimenticola]GLP95366.1 hypothetical protein GCM10007895_06720 [Paraferrimonas sedimenticola]
MRSTKRLTLAALAVAASLQVQAGQNTDVAGSRTFTAEAIEKFTAGYDPYGLASFLSMQAGITLKSSGDPGGEDWMLVRGNGRDSSRMTLMLLDGRPYNSAANNTLEFNTIPVNLIESITVHYGPLPSRFGGYTSVIEITTKKIDGENQIRAFGGSKKTYGGVGTFSYKGDVSVLLNIDYHQTDGLKGEQYRERKEETSFGPFGPVTELVEHVNTYQDRGYRQLVPTFKLATNVGEDVQFELLAQALLTKKRFADGLSPVEVDQEAERDRRFYNLGLNFTPTAESSKDFGLNVYLNYEDKETLVLPDELVNYGEQKKSQVGVRGFGVTPLSEWASFRVGGELDWTKGEVKDDAMVTEVMGQFGPTLMPVSTDELPNPYFLYQDELKKMAIYGELNLKVGRYADVGIGTRSDSIIGGQSELSPYYSLQVHAGGGVSLFASGGQTVRIPGLSEYNNSQRPVQTVLYGMLSGIGVPSMVLDSFEYEERPLRFEKQKGYQFGVKGNWFEDALTVQISSYKYDHEGYTFTDVVAAPVTLFGGPLSALGPMLPAGAPPLGNELPVLYRTNKPTTDVTRGWDASASYQTDAWLWFANASRTDITTKYSDGRAEHRGWFSPPQIVANAGVAFNWDQTHANARIQYRGKTETSLQERGNMPGVELEANTVIHLGLKQGFGGFHLALDVHNVMDKKYETFYGMPMMGRHFTVSAGYRF